MEDKIKKISQEFFQNLGLDIKNLEIIKKEENIFLIKIKSDESKLIIGSHGKNLDAILHVLKVIFKNIDKNLKIYLEVNDYMESKDERLRTKIISKIKIVEKYGEDIKLPFYSSYDRKKIHSFVSDYGDENIYTKSIGEGRDRRLFICKKSSNLNIDIDGIEI